MQQVTPRFRSERAVIAFLAFLGMLMATGIDISLPAFDEIDADLDAGGRESLIVTLYFLGAAFGQLVSGPVSDAIGRQRVVLSGLVLYVIGGAACALAPSFDVLLVSRFVWGLGAAAPTGMRSAIARDLYSGDQMARVTTIMMAVFMLGPIFTPLVGEGLLTVGPWPLVFWFATVLGLVAIAATVAFGETLEVDRRRPLEVAKFREAFRLIVTTRVTLGHVLANIFWTAAFFIFLASSQPVFDRVFDRADDFAFFFALIGVWTVPLLLINNRVISSLGARRTSIATASVSVGASCVGVFWLLAIDDTPSFWLFFRVAGDRVGVHHPDVAPDVRARVGADGRPCRHGLVPAAVHRIRHRIGARSLVRRPGRRPCHTVRRGVCDVQRDRIRLPTLGQTGLRGYR